MKAKMKLVTILVNQINFLYACKKYESKASFQASLKDTPLLFIKSIHILYELNKNSIVLVELKSKKGTDWKAYVMDKPIFYFECFNSKEFMNVFEQHLYEELEKIDVFHSMQIE